MFLPVILKLNWIDFDPTIMLPGVGIRAVRARPALFGDFIASSSHCRHQNVSNRASLSTFSGRAIRPSPSPTIFQAPHRPQMRFKSIFEHRWFHPEPPPGQPPRQSYRVFWTVSLLLGGLGVAYIQWIDPYLAERFADKQKAMEVQAGPVFDKDKFLPFTIKRIEPYNLNTKLQVLFISADVVLD